MLNVILDCNRQIRRSPTHKNKNPHPQNSNTSYNHYPIQNELHTHRTDCHTEHTADYTETDILYLYIDGGHNLEFANMTVQEFYQSRLYFRP